jgi:hypothetical protein
MISDMDGALFDMAFTTMAIEARKESIYDSTFILYPITLRKRPSVELYCMHD